MQKDSVSHIEPYASPFRPTLRDGR